MSVFIKGQRWISESEPDLGLGTVVQAGDGRVRVESKAAGELRTYAMDQAPLKRVRFRVGDSIRTQEDKEFIVTDVVEQRGVLIYVSDRQQLPEAQVNDRVSLQGPQERLLAGRFDPSTSFAFTADHRGCNRRQLPGDGGVFPVLPCVPGAIEQAAHRGVKLDSLDQCHALKAAAPHTRRINMVCTSPALLKEGMTRIKDLLNP